MALTDAQQRDLKDLRFAAHTRNLEQAQFLLKRLLRDMSYYGAVALVVERLQGYLDLFESYYPDEAWVRTLLLAITNYGMTPDDSVAEAALQQGFDAPGAGNYIKAIYDLTQAMQPKHTPEARTGFLMSAIVNSIMAELVEAWYGERVQVWQRLRQLQQTLQASPDANLQTEALNIQHAFWMDAQTMALDSASWLEVADSLEAKLNREQGLS